MRRPSFEERHGVSREEIRRRWSDHQKRRWEAVRKVTRSLDRLIGDERPGHWPR